MSLDDTVSRYCLAWSSSNAADRERDLRASCTADVAYMDPLANVSTLDALLQHIAGLHGRFPGFKVLPTSGVDGHGGFARFSWRIPLPDGGTMVEGTDFVQMSTDGTRIERVVGFFGPLPSLHARGIRLHAPARWCRRPYR